MKVGRQTAFAFCPDCEERIQLDTDPELGQRVLCPHCWANLEVIRLWPLKLSWDTGENLTGWKLMKEVVVD